MLATIVQVESPLPAGMAVGIGQTVPFQVIYDAPVAVIGSPQARVNVQKPSSAQAVAQFNGISGGGHILNFSYTVAVGDVQLGIPPQFDVLLAPDNFLIGGSIINVSTGLPADRNVTASDVTIADWNPGLRADGVAPPQPLVQPTVYVNPTVWQGGAWSDQHPDYFVIRGTAGTGPLPADEVLTVTVNGATYRATSTSATTPGSFFVGATGQWEIRIRPVGLLPATAPTSGTLAPWSTTDSANYNVIATLTDAAGNTSTSGSSAQVVIDMIAPELTNVLSTIPAGTYTVGDVLDVYVQYDEPIRVIGNPTLEIDITPTPKTAAYDPVATAAWPDRDRVYFTYTIQPGDATAALDFVATTSLNLNGGFIEDLAANPAPITLPAPGGPNSLAGQKTIEIDTTAPILATPFVAATVPNGTYVVGGPPITLTATFSKPVVVTGTPQIELNSFPGRVAVYSGGSGTNTLSFTYVVQPGDDTGDLDYASNSALQLNGGQIQDIAGNNAVLTLPAPGSANSLAGQHAIVVAATPTVIQVESPDLAGLYTAGDTVRIRVAFSKVVTVTATQLPVLQLGTQPTPAVAQWARYIDPNTGNPSSAASIISEFEYLVKPGDTTNGQFLNYLATNSLNVGAGMNLVWTGPAIPNVLAADPTLPPLVDADNLLPQAQIVIGPDSVAPAAPILTLNDTTNDIGNYPTDGITRIQTVAVSGLENGFNVVWEYKIGSGAWIKGGPISPTGTSSFTLPATSASGVTVYSPGDLQVRQSDWSGNVSPVATNPIAWTIDLAPPATLTGATIPETGPTGSGITTNPTVTVTGLAPGALLQWNGTYSPAGGGSVSPNPQTWINVGGTGFDTFPGGTFTFDLPVGVYNPATGSGVVVRQQDIAGNPSATPPWVQLNGGASVEVTNDVTPPLAPVIGLTADTTNDIGNYTNDGVTRNQSVSVSGLETAAGTTWQYRLGGASSSWLNGGPISATGTSSFTLPSASPAGTLYPVGSVEVRQTDRVGNVSPVVTNAAAWTIDIDAPATPSGATIPETGPAGSGITSNPTVTVTGLAQGALVQWNPTYSASNGGSVSGPWVSVPGTGIDSFPGGSVTFILPSGTYDPAAGTGVVVRQQDLAGNTSATPPWTQLTTSTGGTRVVVIVDTSITAPAMGLAQDTTPGFSPYTGSPYTTDGVTQNNVVNVTGLEVQNLSANPPQAGIDRWEYRINGGAWILGGTSAPTGSFTLPTGTYAPGSVEVREFDLAGNQATTSNSQTWSIDTTNPAIASISAAAGPYTAGQTVALAVNFTEPVFLSNSSPTLSLNIGGGRVATLATPVPVGGAGASTLTFNYVVQVGDTAAALAVTAFSLGTSQLADLAGNSPTALTLPSNPYVLGGPVVIDASICASSPGLGTTAPGPALAGPVLKVPIQFNTPVTGFGIGNIRLFWNERSTSLKGAWLTGSGANYELMLPRVATSLDGQYRLQISPTGIRSVAGSIPMTVPCNIYWQIGEPVAPPPPSPTLTAIGPNLAYDASNGDLYAYGAKVTMSGAAVNYNAYASQGWNAMAAAKPNGVTTIVWRHASGNLHFWRLSSASAHVSSDGWQAPSTAEFFATETTFQADLNGDSIIGAPPSGPTLTALESNGSVTLARDASGQLYANGQRITLSGNPVDYFGYVAQGWTAAAADVRDGVNTLVWRHASGNLHFWRLSSTWAHVTSEGWQTPGSAAFDATEVAFQTDLNSNGIVGQETMIEAVGGVRLSRDSNGYLYANGQRITIGGNPVDFFSYAAQGWTAAAADVRNGVNTLVWRHASGNLHFWRLSTNWAHVSSDGWQASGSADFISTELAFGIDFNNNGTVGS